jgi:hypothetical protein
MEWGKPSCENGQNRQVSELSLTRYPKNKVRFITARTVLFGLNYKMHSKSEFRCTAGHTGLEHGHLLCKVQPSFAIHLTMSCRGRGDRTLRINMESRWMWVVSFTFRPVYLWGNSSRNTLKRILGGPPVLVRAWWQTDNSCHYPEPSPGRPIRSQSLCWLSYAMPCHLIAYLRHDVNFTNPTQNCITKERTLSGLRTCETKFLNMLDDF